MFAVTFTRKLSAGMVWVGRPIVEEVPSLETGFGTGLGDPGTGPGDPGIGLGVPGTLFIGVKAPLWQPVPRHGVEKQCSGFRRVDVTSRATLHNLHCEFVRGYQPLVRAET